MHRAQCPDQLLDPPERFATRPGRPRKILFTIAGHARAIEQLITGGLDQGNLVVLTEAGQALDGERLTLHQRRIEIRRLQPVAIIGEIDHRPRTYPVEHLGQPGSVPALRRGLGGNEFDARFGTGGE